MTKHTFQPGEFVRFVGRFCEVIRANNETVVLKLANAEQQVNISYVEALKDGDVINEEHGHKLGDEDLIEAVLEHNRTPLEIFDWESDESRKLAEEWNAEVAADDVNYPKTMEQFKSLPLQRQHAMQLAFVEAI